MIGRAHVCAGPMYRFFTVTPQQVHWLHFKSVVRKTQEDDGPAAHGTAQDSKHRCPFWLADC